jgi:hypothetical protein
LKLHDDWKWIVSHAWSVRFTVAAFMLSALETFLGLVAHTNHLPPTLFAAISAVVTGAAFVARLVAQDHPDGK